MLNAYLLLGWNDPPKYVGMPTGNLKINLNKRVAFPLSSPAATQNTTVSPLLLPPKPPTESQLQPNMARPEDSTIPEADRSSQKDKVLSVLTKGIEELSSTTKSTVAAKLKTLEDDWQKLDLEIIKLLVELSQCKLLSFVSLSTFHRQTFILDLETKDTKNASATHRKIVMKGCSKQWLHAIRQIIMNLETANNEDPASTGLLHRCSSNE